MLLEVIVQTIEDARAAAAGGADRLEIVRDISSGGLTPSLALVRAIAAETPLPLRVMVRENAGFDTSADELRRMRDAIAALRDASVDGIVIGFARRGALALDAVTAALEGMDDVRATFHRAFDALDDQLAGIDAIATIPQIDRILTSGGAGARQARAARLRACVDRAGNRLTIIAGGGVDEALLALLAATGSVKEVHVGRAARLGNDRNAVVSVERVRKLMGTLKGGRI